MHRKVGKIFEIAMRNARKAQMHLMVRERNPSTLLARHSKKASVEVIAFKNRGDSYKLVPKQVRSNDSVNFRGRIPKKEKFVHSHPIVRVLSFSNPATGVASRIAMCPAQLSFDDLKNLLDQKNRLTESVSLVHLNEKGKVVPAGAVVAKKTKKTFEPECVKVQKELLNALEKIKQIDKYFEEHLLGKPLGGKQVEEYRNALDFVKDKNNWKKAGLLLRFVPAKGFRIVREKYSRDHFEPKN